MARRMVTSGVQYATTTSRSPLAMAWVCVSRAKRIADSSGDCEEEGMLAQPARKKAESAAAQAKAEIGCDVTYVFQACRVESPV